MKKILFLLVFLFSILRGSSLSAQQPLKLNISHVITDSSCSPRCRVTMTATGGVRPYLFRIDSFYSSTTGIFENIGLSVHTFTVTDSLNTRVSRVTLLPSIWGGLRTSLTNFNSATNTMDLDITITGRSPLQYKLDGGAFQDEKIFRNVPIGRHLLTVRDVVGCELVSYVYIYPLCNPQYTWNYTEQCNQTGDLVVYSAQQGYVFSLNAISPDTDSAGVKFVWHNVSNGAKQLSISSSDCNLRVDSLQLGSNNNASLYAYVDFRPNSCGDSIGTAKISLYPSNVVLATPLSMSFDSRPFSSDSVFSNVLLNHYYNLKVKTQNCGERTVNVYTWHSGPLRNIESFFTLTNCSTQTGVLRTRINGGSQPYRVTLDGLPEQTLDSNTVTWSNIRVGSTRTIRVRSAEGCDTTITIIAKDIPQTPQYRYYAACGQVGDLAINLNRNYTYQLDNQNPSRDTGFDVIWQYIAQGKHVLKMTDSAGCTQIDTITLYGIGLNINTTRSSNICSDSSYSLVVSGGVPPYTYKLNNNAATTANDFKLTAARYYYVEVTDANYCHFSNYVYVYPQDSVIIMPSISPQPCNGTSTIIAFSVPDTNAARPLSISFDGRPFSSDTVYQNVQSGRSYTVIVKSKQGCDLRTSLYVPGNNSALNVFLRDTCVNRLGNTRLSPMTYGGVSPVHFAWNTGQTTWDIVVPVGQYSVTVTDANGCQATATAKVTSCVWSGDTDTSGIVDNRDLLNIGLAFGETGPKRCLFDSVLNHPYCTIWAAQKATDWSKQTPARTNYKHIDTNGDGIINGNDTIAIIRNWNQVHQFRAPQTPIVTERNAAPPISIQTSSVGEGQWASFPILLGDATATADNVYGLAFSVKYPPSVIEPNSMRLVVNQSWMGASSTLLNVFKDEFDNVFHIGLVKTNKLNVTGSGQIATLVFKLKTGTKGSDLQFGVYNDFLINNNGQQLTSVGRTTSVKVLTETAEPIWANQIQVYPNPTTDKFFIETQNIDIESITILDIAGKMIEKTSQNTPLSIKAVGTYFLKIETDKGTVMKKVVRL